MSEPLINELAVKAKMEQLVESHLITALNVFIKRDWEDRYSNSVLRDYLTSVVSSFYEDSTNDEIKELESQLEEKALVLKKMRLEKKLQDIEKQITRLKD